MINWKKVAVVSGSGLAIIALCYGGYKLFTSNQIASDALSSAGRWLSGAKERVSDYFIKKEVAA